MFVGLCRARVYKPNLFAVGDCQVTAHTAAIRQLTGTYHTYNRNMRVALFVPCYIGQFYPQVAIATLQVLTRLGCHVEVRLQPGVPRKYR
jgi:Fe-S oxidoreductase